MENRIKEQQLGLFADRTSAATMRANQLRLWLSSVAYVLMSALRRLGLAGTAWAGAQCDTIRLKLLKIGAQVRMTVRKVWLSLSEAYPYQALFAAVYENLHSACVPVPPADIELSKHDLESVESRSMLRRLRRRGQKSARTAA